MKCKWIECSNDARAKSPFCGDTCYKRWNRDNKRPGHPLQSTNSDKLVLNHPPKSDKTNSDNATRTQLGQPGRAVMLSLSDLKPPNFGQPEGNISAEELDKLNAVCGEPTGLIVDAITGEPPCANYGRQGCECQHCISNRTNGNKHVLNHGAWKTVAELGDNELNRVSLPGDIDYKGVAV